jgi:hypothetical protein
VVDLGCREDNRARKRDEVVALRGGRGWPDLRAKATVWLGNAIDAGMAAAACVMRGEYKGTRGSERRHARGDGTERFELTWRWQSNVNTENSIFSNFADDQNASFAFSTRFWSKSAESASWSWGVRDSFSDIY